MRTTMPLTVAQDGASVPVVINYLRYQIGRAPGNDVGWRWQGIGEHLISLLEKVVRTQAHHAAERAVGRIRGPGTSASQEELRKAWIQLTRRFLALLRCRFVQRVRDLRYRKGNVG